MLALATGHLAAQKIHLMTQSDGSAVRLRWAIDDPGDWQWANDNGYTITRMTRRLNGQQLAVGDQAVSRVTLVNNLRPRATAEWGPADLDQAALGVLDDAQWTTSDPGTFAGAAEEATNQENRLFFAHALAERDFDLARGLALGYTDFTAAAGAEYIYVIKINELTRDGAALNAGAKGGLEQGRDDLGPVAGLRVENGDTSVRVGWSTESVEHLYTSYDIYRSPTGNAVYQKANSIPFMAGYVGTGDDPKYAVFTDSVATYGAYDYYVVGRTPFGLFGPPSDTVSASSRPEALNLIMRMDSIVTTETQVDLYWPGITAEYNDKMVVQRVYRAEHVKSAYEVVSPESFGVGERSWRDNSPYPAGYYIVELEDENGHVYRTQPQVGQLEDQTPPAMPTGFTGEDQGDGTLTLTWNANQEADLNGYQLFRCYARGGEFAAVEVELLNDTTYTDNLVGTIVNDSIFYRLMAKDLRDNGSVKTPVLVVGRVDITPPGKPTLARVSPTPAGVAFSWTYSADNDVVRHELQRRPKGTANWVTLVTVPEAEEDEFVIENFDAEGSINYLDDSGLPRGEYDYQLLAFDEMNLGAGSEIITIRPHDSGERGTIRDLAVSASCADSTVVTDLDEAVGQSLVNFMTFVEEEEQASTQQPASEEQLKSVFQALEISGLVTMTEFGEWQSLTLREIYERVKEIYGVNGPQTKFTNCAVQLEWSYPLDAGILHFQLYRSRQGSRLRPYKALPVEYFFSGTVPTGRQLLSFTDEGALPGARYVYKVMALHLDGGYSREGSGVTVVVE